MSIYIKVKIRITDKYRERIKVMMVLGMVLAMIVAGCAEYGARSNMKDFA